MVITNTSAGQLCQHFIRLLPVETLLVLSNGVNNDKDRNTIRDGGSTTLYAAYTVYTAYIIDTVDMVYTVDTAYTVYAIETALHC